MRSLRRFAPLLALWLAACGGGVQWRGDARDAALPGLIHYFAEFCALSEMRQKHGFGAGLSGGAGGHAVLYLHGACRGPADAEHAIRLCDEAGAEPADGVGLSMNAHFRNAKWVAVPGRAFFFDGGLPTDAPLTPAAYAATQAEAKRLGLYDRVAFHETVFAGLPPDTQREDWRYEVSIATDYAIGFGRGRFCARVPLNRAQLAAAVEHLNAENAPYRTGGREFRWRLFQDNCIHLAHNALAAAGVWPVWRTDRPWLLAMLNFPVPRNEFVNLMRRTGDAALLDPWRLHADPAARRALLEFGQLPLRPGALMQVAGPRAPNAVYDTALRLIFYDEPLFGPYRGWSDALQSDPRRSDPDRNATWVAACWREALARRRPLDWWLARRPRDPVGFAATYGAFYALLEAATASAPPSAEAC